MAIAIMSMTMMIATPRGGCFFSRALSIEGVFIETQLHTAVVSEGVSHPRRPSFNSLVCPVQPSKDARDHTPRTKTGCPCKDDTLPHVRFGTAIGDGDLISGTRRSDVFGQYVVVELFFVK